MTKLLFVAAAAMLFVSPAVPALAGPRITPSSASAVQLTQGKPDKDATKKKSEKAGKKDKSDSQSAGRSNTGGETRGEQRAQEVQGMQDSGKGAQQRGQRPAK